MNVLSDKFEKPLDWTYKLSTTNFAMTLFCFALLFLLSNKFSTRNKKGWKMNICEHDVRMGTLKANKNITNNIN